MQAGDAGSDGADDLDSDACDVDDGRASATASEDDDYGPDAARVAAAGSPAPPRADDARGSEATGGEGGPDDDGSTNLVGDVGASRQANPRIRPKARICADAVHGQPGTGEAADEDAADDDEAASAHNDVEGEEAVQHDTRDVAVELIEDSEPGIASQDIGEQLLEFWGIPRSVARRYAQKGLTRLYDWQVCNKIDTCRGRGVRECRETGKISHPLTITLWLSEGRGESCEQHGMSCNLLPCTPPPPTSHATFRPSKRGEASREQQTRTS